MRSNNCQAHENIRFLTFLNFIIISQINLPFRLNFEGTISAAELLNYLTSKIKDQLTFN